MESKLTTVTITLSVNGKESYAQIIGAKDNVKEAVYAFIEKRLRRGLEK